MTAQLTNGQDIPGTNTNVSELQKSFKATYPDCFEAIREDLLMNYVFQ